MKILAKILSIAIITLMITSIASASTNLLNNGDALDGLNGWENPDGLWVTRTSYDGQIDAYDGYFFFPIGFKGADGARTRIYQDVYVKDYAGKLATLSAYNRTWSNGHTDESMLMMEFFDAVGNLLDRASVTSSRKADWHKIEVSRPIPNNAVTARISLYAIYHTGSEVDSYFDNVSFTVEGNNNVPLSNKENGDITLIIYLDEGENLEIGALTGGKVNNSVTYSSSDNSIVKVYPRGKITALKEGSAIITAQSGGTSIKFQVIVEK